MKKSLTVEDVIAEMKRHQGQRSDAEFARALGITQAYLGDIYKNRRTPGPAILEHLRLVKKISYERVA